MATDDPYPEKAELADTPIVREVEEKLVEWVKGNVPGADKSTADVESLELDRVNWVARIRAKVVAKNSTEAVFPFSITSTVTFNFHLQTRQTSNEHLTIHTRGPDIKLDLETIKEVLEGNFAKAIELIPNGGVVVREILSDYDRIRDSYYGDYGRPNVYFASARFVRWASAGTVARWVGQTIASGGSAAAAIMAEVKKESLKELALVLAWLRTRGMQEAANVAQKLLTGEQVDWPNIKLVWQSVRYASKLRVANQQIGSEFAVNRHAAFVIVWTSSSVSGITDNDELEPDTPDAPPRDHNATSRSLTPVLFMLD